MNTTEPITFGRSMTFQARCSCGWMSRIAHRAPVGNEYRTRTADMLARGDYDFHAEGAQP